ncbi:MAG: glycerate kinase [Planctomycetota bacterium]|nr:glycerate kinase [Planctomycetota bacterium]
MTRPKIVVAPSAFKGTLSPRQAAAAMTRGIRSALPEAEVIEIPVADGGDGTLDVLLDAIGGEPFSKEVTGPLGDPVEARVGILPDGTAVLEMAEASGLALCQEQELDPLAATTFGTGELILAALERGASKIWVTLGGSATIDGGVGMAQALGAGLLDVSGEALPRGGGALGLLGAIYPGSLDRRILDTEFVGLVDVRNPLLGDEGAAAVYGPQKGATPDQIQLLEGGLKRFHELAMDWRPEMSPCVPGDGAAGGLGFGVRFFLSGRLELGAGYVLDAVGFPEQIRDARLVMTGEGKLDHQSWSGKVVGEVVERCGMAGVPCWVLAGQVEEFTSAGALKGVETRSLSRTAEGPERAGEILEEATRRWLEEAWE